MFIVNYSRCFQNTSIIDTKNSDFHELVVTVLKIYYKKQKSKSLKTEKTNQKQSYTKINKDMDESITKNKVSSESFNYNFSIVVGKLKIEQDIDRQSNLSIHPNLVSQAIETFTSSYTKHIKN